VIQRGDDGSPARVVFDTNVLLSLWVFEDSRFAPFRAAVDRGEWTAFTDAECLAEFKRVLGYPQFDLSAERQSDIYGQYAAAAVLDQGQQSFSKPLPRCSDRDDQKFLELARRTSADWLVTADKALLRMARRDKLAGLFRIVTPETLLSAMQEAT
jgi:putative PIN family toxin of toxin-antitoxin system